MKRDPFITPEGYFDTLTERVMSNIPHNDSSVYVSRQRRIRKIVCSAAAVAVGMLSCLWYGYALFAADEDVVAEKQYEESYSVDEFADYAMLDHQEIYDMLMER